MFGMQILDGKLLSKNIKEEIAIEVAEMIQNGQKQPHLAAILVGIDGASEEFSRGHRQCRCV